MLAERSSSIHSGHFMVSCIYEADDDAELVGTVKSEPDRQGYNFDAADWKLRKSYMFGNRSTNTLAIDASLTKLFECMTLAYSGKIVSPKWKNFRGIKVKLKDKIRLNNIIWREWHRQFRQKKLPIICQFEAPVSDRTHSKPEAVVLEGKYWKRRLLCVTTEYMKWRQYYKEKSHRFVSSSGRPTELESFSSRLTVSSASEARRSPSQLQLNASTSVSEEQSSMEADFAMDFSGTLFSTFNQMFPDPKEMSQVGFSDIIQPGLIQLQPSFDDFMDTLPSLSDMWTTSAVPASQGTEDSNFVSHGAQPVSASDDTCVAALEERILSGVGNWTGFSGGSANFSEGSVVQSEMTASVTDDDVGRQSGFVWHLPEDARCPSSVGRVTTPRRTEHQIRGVSADNVRSDSTVGVDSPPLLHSEFHAPHSRTLQATSRLSSVVVDWNTSHVLSAGHSAPKRRSSDYCPVGCHASDATVTVQLLKQRANSLHTLTPSTSSLLQNVLTKSQDRTGNSGRDSFPFVAPRQQVQHQQTAVLQQSSQPVSERKLAVEPTSDQHAEKLTASAATKHVTFTDEKNVQRSLHQNTGNQNVSPHHCSILQALLTRGTQRQSKATVATTSAATAAAKSQSQPSSEQIEPFADSEKSESQTGHVVKQTHVNEFQKTLLVAAASHAVGSTLDSRLVNDLLSGSELVEHSSSDDTAATISPVSAVTGESALHRLHSQKEQHMTAEYKRRCNIKHGFDTLNQLVPSLNQVSSGKINKATTLEKTAEFCRRMKDERMNMLNEANKLSEEILALQADISGCQSQLPATGAPVSHTALHSAHMTQLYDSYVRSRTLANWKFWIFSLIIRSLFESFSSSVLSVTSPEEFSRSVLAWLQQHCSLVALRPGVLTSLRHLSTSTSILTDPAGVPQQATDAVSKRT